MISFWLLLITYFSMSYNCNKEVFNTYSARGYTQAIFIDMGLVECNLNDFVGIEFNILASYGPDEEPTPHDPQPFVSEEFTINGVQKQYLVGQVWVDYQGAFYFREINLTNLANEINNKFAGYDYKFTGFKITTPSGVVDDVCVHFQNIVVPAEPDELVTHYQAIVLTAQWGYEINYYDEGGSEFSGAHESGYATTHTNGTATQLDMPTKDGYTFAGWYDNAECTGSPITELSASTTYSGAINLYAKWTSNDITLTFTCTNYSNQNYFIYIYEGENIKYQMYVQGQATVKLSYSDKQYKIQFVLSYLGSVSYSVNGGVTQNNKSIILSDLKNTNITYQITTANINNSIII